MARVIVRPKARQEIYSILAYYIETADIEVARRFRKAATAIFRELAEFPLMRAPRKVNESEFQGVRMWREDSRAISSSTCPCRWNCVERLIHASQDYRRLLR